MVDLRHWKLSLWGALIFGLMSCGGSNDALPSKAQVNQVYVMGDSLADVGTFGYKFTIQDTSQPKGLQIWPQLVASAFGLDGSSQCNHYQVATSETTFITSSNTRGCTNFAIGDSRIVYGSVASTNPLNLSAQMSDKSGNYSATDLVLVDGGGNDAADLVSAYLGADSAPAIFQSFLAQQLSPSEISSYLVQTNGGAMASGAYMQKLAQTFYSQIKAQLLDRGATRVAILNVPDITLTPRFQRVLQNVSDAYGGGTAGANTAASLQATIRTWISTYNTQLQTSVGQDSRVAVVDFYADFTDEVTTPRNYSLTNVTSTACPSTGMGLDGLPEYDFPTCTVTSLDATAGKTAGWWKSYAFSDGFHPTPYGHQLLAASVSRALARAGWL